MSQIRKTLPEYYVNKLQNIAQTVSLDNGMELTYGDISKWESSATNEDVSHMITMINHLNEVGYDYENNPESEASIKKITCVVLGVEEEYEDEDYISNEQFIEDVYELAAGDDAINRDYSHKEILGLLKDIVNGE